jgi:hypothetical protein
MYVDDWFEAVSASWLRYALYGSDTHQQLVEDLRNGALNLEAETEIARAGGNPRAGWLGFAYQYHILVGHALEALRNELTRAAKAKELVVIEGLQPNELRRAWDEQLRLAHHTDRRWKTAIEYERNEPAGRRQRWPELLRVVEEDFTDHRRSANIDFFRRQSKPKWQLQGKLLVLSHETIVLGPLHALATSIRAHRPGAVGAFFGLDGLETSAVVGALQQLGVDLRYEGFDLAAVVRGATVELEHTRMPIVATSIAVDHLRERPDYYERLAKL